MPVGITLPNGAVADISPWTLGQTGPAWTVQCPANWNLTGVLGAAIGMNIYTNVALPNNGGYTFFATSAGIATPITGTPPVFSFAPNAGDITTAGLYYVKFFATINALLYYTDYLPWQVTK